MNEKNDSIALLPNGFADLLPPFAESEARAINILMEKFSSFGYRRVKPPLLEFEDSLLAPGPGARLSNDTFRFMDPVTNRMLGLRSDLTAQISRIVSSRFCKGERPLRLAYANDVLRRRGSQMRTERQFVQVGCELVGSSDCIESDVEICVLSILGLKSLGIKDITLDLTLPKFVSYLLKNVDDGEAKIIRKYVEQRDFDALVSLKSSTANSIAQAMVASGNADDAIAKIEVIELDEGLCGDIKHLKLVCDGVKGALSDLKIDDVTLSIDVLEQEGFEYHNAFGFTLFAAGLSAELGRGGAYDVCFGHANDDGEVARGFTIYMDALAGVIGQVAESDKVFVSSAESWDVISGLQNEGWVVVRGGSDGDAPVECTHIYKNNKITKL